MVPHPCGLINVTPFSPQDSSLANLVSNLNFCNTFGPYYVQTPILWCHGMADMKVLFEAGQEGPPFLQRAGINCEFKVQLAVIIINILILIIIISRTKIALFAFMGSHQDYNISLTYKAKTFIFALYDDLDVLDFVSAHFFFLEGHLRYFINSLNFLYITIKQQAYPDLGHSISDEELKHMESWIISHLLEIIPNQKNNNIYAQNCFCIFTQRRKKEKEVLESTN